MSKRPDYAKVERRFDAIGEWRAMTEAEGYVMCRRPGRIPRVMSRKEWDAMSRTASAIRARNKEG